MAQIVTLTMNPSIDMNSSVEQVTPERKLRCAAPRYEPGGGGINVARVVARLGGEAGAVFTSGGDMGDMLGDLLEESRIVCKKLRVSGDTRISLTVNENASNRQFRFVMPGPPLSEKEWGGAIEAVAQWSPRPDCAIASGSLPPGVPSDFYAQLAQALNRNDIRFILDTSGEALRHGVGEGVFLIKPNMRELGAIAGAEISNEKQQETVARRIVDEGKARIVAVSLGAGGALLVTEKGSRHLRSPTVPIKSKVGAGDSMVGGIAVGLMRNMEIADAVRFGIAAGAAAVMTPGTELCRGEDTEKLFERLHED